ncbi:hypothetical protein AZG88_29445 [Rhodococcus sp. LB1]|nr:hypothetical protein AZG88_29445 [Rhodococcus sp. LB1]
MYSLGATLFCAVTGHAAFERRSGEQLVAQFLRITSEPAPPLRREHIPPAVAAAIEHAMATDPDARPATAASFGEQLRQAQRLTGLADEFRTEREQDDAFTVPYTTINVGTVRGGLAVNIVPESCEFEWEMRTVRAEHHREISTRFHSFMNDLQIEMQIETTSARTDHEVLADFPGLTPTHAAQEFIDVMGYTSEATGVSYGTEAGLISELGVPTIVCGPGSIEQAHRADEWVELAQVQQCFDSMLALQQHLVEPVASSIRRMEKVDLV